MSRTPTPYDAVSWHSARAQAVVPALRSHAHGVLVPLQELISLVIESRQSCPCVRALPQDDHLSQGKMLSDTPRRWEKGIFPFALFCASHSLTVGQGRGAPGGHSWSCM